MKYLLILSILALSCLGRVSLSGTNDCSARFGLTKVKSFKDSTAFYMEIENTGESTLRMLRMSTADICYGILNLSIYSNEKNITYQAMPCIAFKGLDRVDLTSENSVYLEPTDTYRFMIQLSNQDFAPYLPDNELTGDYVAKAELPLQLANIAQCEGATFKTGGLHLVDSLLLQSGRR